MTLCQFLKVPSVLSTEPVSAPHLLRPNPVPPTMAQGIRSASKHTSCGQSDRAASKPFQTSELLRVFIRASLKHALKVLSHTRESSLVRTSLPRGCARHPWPPEHTKASPMDGACALKPCQTNFHTPAGGHDPKLDCDGELQLAEEQSKTFFPKARLFRTKDLGQVRGSQLLPAPILDNKSESKPPVTPCHWPPPSRSHTLLCE